MGYAELIQQRVQNLTSDKQAQVFDFVEFIARRTQTSQGQTSEQSQQSVMAALAAARAAWPTLEPHQIEAISANLRSQWDGRGWDPRFNKQCHTGGISAH